MYVSVWVAPNEAVIAGQMPMAPRIGERIEAGGLIYHVDDVEWSLSPITNSREIVTSAAVHVTEIGTAPYPRARQFQVRNG